MKDTVRLNFEFPRKDYPYLKMLCAEKGISFRQFATELMLHALEEHEDRSLAKKARKKLKEMDPKDNIPFHQAVKEAGWEVD